MKNNKMKMTADGWYTLRGIGEKRRGIIKRNDTKASENLAKIDKVIEIFEETILVMKARYIEGELTYRKGYLRLKYEDENGRDKFSFKKII